MESEPSESIFQTNGINKKKIQLKAKCIKGHQSSLACNNFNCNQYAFVCGNKNCECRISHKKCLLTCTDQILQVIQQKRSQSNDVIDKVCLVLDKWIDQISRTRQKIQDTLLDWGLSGAQKKFISLIQNQQYKQLTGHHINQITSQTVSYYNQQTKQKLFYQIDKIQQNYDSQIKSIMKSVTLLFQKYQLKQKDIAFKQQKQVEIQQQYNLLLDFQNFKNHSLRKMDQKLKKQDYQKLIQFMKSALRKDFQVHMNKYRRSRRAYGTKKLRQKYFEEYYVVLTQGKQYIKKWQLSLQANLKYISQNFGRQIQQFSKFYHQSDGQVEKTFTPEMALSLQRTINIIEKLIEFTKTKGKQKLRVLLDKDKRIDEKYELIMYLLDEIMDDHPQIDEVDAMWNVIRFQQKLTNEINLLYDVIGQAKQTAYTYELNDKLF